MLNQPKLSRPPCSTPAVPLGFADPLLKTSGIEHYKRIYKGVIRYAALIMVLLNTASSSLSPLRSRMSFCQYLAQVTADGVGSARSSGLNWRGSSHSSRWDIVCDAPQLHVSSGWLLHSFIGDLLLPSSTRRVTSS